MTHHRSLIEIASSHCTAKCVVRNRPDMMLVGAKERNRQELEARLPALKPEQDLVRDIDDRVSVARDTREYTELLSSRTNVEPSSVT